MGQVDFLDGATTFVQDGVDVADRATGTRVGADGSGVYVAVVDSGLVDIWRQYFPEERIDREQAIAFAGGGPISTGTVTDTPNVWEKDVDSHGTAVTSAILGFDVRGRSIGSVAPRITVIAVKVMSQHGVGFASVVTRGILYVADLKAGPLRNSPVVMNMSFGSRHPAAIELSALDYAIERSVIPVASGGNDANAGMRFPGAYPPVISAAAEGLVVRP